MPEENFELIDEIHEERLGPRIGLGALALDDDEAGVTGREGCGSVALSPLLSMLASGDRLSSAVELPFRFGESISRVLVEADVLSLADGDCSSSWSDERRDERTDPLCFSATVAVADFIREI